MKHLLLCFALCLGSVLYGQNLFPSPGLTFGEAYFPVFGVPTDTFHYDTATRYLQDTLLCGEPVHHFISRNKVEYFYQVDDGKVYAVVIKGECDQVVKRMIYDFTLEVGDAILMTSASLEVLNFKLVVQKVDTIVLLDGKPRKHFIVAESPKHTHFDIVEGIGFLQFGWNYYFEWEGQHNEMICVRDKDGIIYQNPAFDSKVDCDSLNCFVKFDIEPECQGMTYQFNNRSHFASSYEWDFGDGTTSTEVNPSHTYQDPGCYNVQVVAQPDCPSSPQIHRFQIDAGKQSYWPDFPKPDFSFYKGYVKDLNHLLLFEHSVDKVYYTDDAGSDWTPSVFPDSVLDFVYYWEGVDFWDSQHGILSGYFESKQPKNSTFGSLYLTSDGGHTWESISPEHRRGFSNILYVAENNIFASTKWGFMIHSIDNGVSWDTIKGLSQEKTDFICATSPTNIYFVGVHYQGMTQTSIQFGQINADSLVSHSTILPLFDQWPRVAVSCIYFQDSLHGWVGLTNGTIIHTNDAGQTWSKQIENVGCVNDIYFEDSGHGLAVGHGGLILETFNGGLTWDSTFCLGTKQLDRIFWDKSTLPVLLGRGVIKYFDPFPETQDCGTVSTSIPHVRMRDLLIQPNPVGSSRLVQIGYPELKNGTMTMYNASGQQVYTRNIAQSDQFEMDCSFLPTGFYMVHLLDGTGQRYSGKLIVY